MVRGKVVVVDGNSRTESMNERMPPSHRTRMGMRKPVDEFYRVDSQEDRRTTDGEFYSVDSLANN